MRRWQHPQCKCIVRSGAVCVQSVPKCIGGASLLLLAAIPSWVGTGTEAAGNKAAIVVVRKSPCRLLLWTAKEETAA